MVSKSSDGHVLTCQDQDKIIWWVSEWFGVNVGVHQDSVLSPLLFIIVMEAVTHSVKEGIPWEMLYANDHMLMSTCRKV